MITQDENSRWSNREEDLITIVPYDRRWVAQFADERRAIRACVDAAIPLVIEHFGSTAIPGVPAKPIIDILLGADRQHWSTIVQALKRIAYVHWADNPDADREFGRATASSGERPYRPAADSHDPAGHVE